RNDARQPNPSILPARTRGFASLNRPRPVRRITPPTLRGHNHAPAQFGNRRAVLGRAITRSATAFQHVHDATDHPAIIYSLDTPYIRRQLRLEPLPRSATNARSAGRVASSSSPARKQLRGGATKRGH